MNQNLQNLFIMIAFFGSAFLAKNLGPNGCIKQHFVRVYFFSPTNMNGRVKSASRCASCYCLTTNKKNEMQTTTLVNSYAMMQCYLLTISMHTLCFDMIVYGRVYARSQCVRSVWDRDGCATSKLVVHAFIKIEPSHPNFRSCVRRYVGCCIYLSMHDEFSVIRNVTWLFCNPIFDGSVYALIPCFRTKSGTISYMLHLPSG